MTTRRLAGLGLAASLAVAQAGAQGARPAAAQQPTFRVEANYVRVDVFATRDGVPVTDLAAADFEVKEDGALQRIEAFEHVMVRGPAPVDAGREPQTVAESREMARDPRTRVFVIFLDTLHTGVSGSHRMQRALVTLLDRILGPDDLFAIMTPEMSAADISFARRTGGVEQMLAKYWTWGRRHQIASPDPVEQMYEQCYPDSDKTAGIAREMIDRRREKLTLDALRDLTVHLRGVREERKAVIAVSDGWLLYRENPALAEQASSGNRIMPRPGVGPTGGLTSDVERARAGIAEADCERDRMQLAMLDDETYFRDLFGLANRSNVSFYPVDSRGLPVFDTDISDPLPPPADSRRLKARLDALQELALNTDGFAVVNSNDIERGLKRIADDLTSYYLLGYYSTNPRLDGRFRKIDVHVTRPGIEVRARRGYRAATEGEMSAVGGGVAGGAAAPAPNAVQRAIGDLPPDRSQVRLRLAAGWAQAPATSETATPGSAAQVWAIGEIDAATLRLPEWSAGGDVDIRLTDPGGETLATSTVAVPAGARSFMSDFGGAALPAGEYVVRVRLRPASSGLPLADVAHVRVPATPAGPGSPRMFRRGPTTGPVYVATADPRFRRAERLRVEWPLQAAAASRAAELVDRNGRAMALPVTITDRADPASGVTWIAAEVALAPLAPGEYAIRLRGEAAGAPFDAVTAFRLVSQ